MNVTSESTRKSHPELPAATPETASSGTDAVPAPSKREFALTLVATAAVSLAVLGGALGVVWLVIGPTLLALGALIVSRGWRAPKESSRASEPRSGSAPPLGGPYLESDPRPYETDSLTGLATTSYLDERLRNLASSRARYGQPYALVLIDIRRLAGINERHGRAAGDRLLQTVGAALSAAVRDIDVVARVGGDEFAVAVPMQTAVKGLQMGARLMTALHLQMPDGQAVEFTIGIAEASKEGTPPIRLRQLAVHVLDAAKDAPGRVAAAQDEPVEQFRGKPPVDVPLGPTRDKPGETPL